MKSKYNKKSINKFEISDQIIKNDISLNKIFYSELSEKDIHYLGKKLKIDEKNFYNEDYPFEENSIGFILDNYDEEKHLPLIQTFSKDIKIIYAEMGKEEFVELKKNLKNKFISILIKFSSNKYHVIWVRK